MPIWLVIMVLGAAGSGFAFLKARDMERKNTLKKVKAGHKDVKKAARRVVKRPSTVEPYEPLRSKEEVQISEDFSSRVARDLEEILKKANV